VIFLKIKMLLGSIVLLVFMLAGLGFARDQVGRQERLLIAIPRIGGATIHVSAVEALNDRVVLISDQQQVRRVGQSRVMLTYAERSMAGISALQANHDVVLVGTNHTFPFVTNHPMIYGRFFGRDAVAYGHRVVVVNKQAAFDLFGTYEPTGNTLQISGMPYRILGVIDDGDTDNRNIYAPISTRGNAVEAIAANLATGAYEPLSAEYILNEWQQIGVTEAGYYFVNFDILRTVIQDRFILALYLLLAGLLLIGIKNAINMAIAKWQALKDLRCEMYALELLKSHTTWKLAGSWGIMTVIICLIGVIGLDGFSRVLIASDAGGMLANIRTDAFAMQLVQMAEWYHWSRLLFWGFATALCVAVGISLSFRSQS